MTLLVCPFLLIFDWNHCVEEQHACRQRVGHHLVSRGLRKPCICSALPTISISWNEHTERTGVECGAEGLSGNEQVQQCLRCLQWLLVNHQSFHSVAESLRNWKALANFTKFFKWFLKHSSTETTSGHRGDESVYQYKHLFVVIVNVSALVLVHSHE